MTARSDHPDLTTCDWTDEFCDCRDLGTIYSLITEEDLCANDDGHLPRRNSVMKSNLAIVSVSLAFAVSSFAAAAPRGVKHHALPSDTAAIAPIPVRLLPL
jgi:hypothetical protein